MTDQELRNQRVQARIDLENAEEGLAHLQMKAIRHADSIASITQKLRTNATLRPSRDDFDVETELKTRVTPDEFALLKASGDQIIAVIAGMRQQRQVVYRLREQERTLSRASGLREN